MNVISTTAEALKVLAHSAPHATPFVAVALVVYLAFIFAARALQSVDAAVKLALTRKGR